MTVLYNSFSLCFTLSSYAYQLEMQPHTQQTIYGLHKGKEYEVHIRCRMRAFIKFGEFSDSIFIQVTEIPSKGKALLLCAIYIGRVHQFEQLEDCDNNGLCFT